MLTKGLQRGQNQDTTLGVEVDAHCADPQDRTAGTSATDTISVPYSESSYSTHQIPQIDSKQVSVRI